jgi:hypothetical protein
MTNGTNAARAFVRSQFYRGSHEGDETPRGSAPRSSLAGRHDGGTNSQGGASEGPSPFTTLALLGLLDFLR